jgi:hypothetical protein
MAVSGVACPQIGQPASLFYPFESPAPSAHGASIGSMKSTAEAAKRQKQTQKSLFSGFFSAFYWDTRLAVIETEM